MSQYQRQFMKGQLYVKFNVEFPDAGALSDEQCHLLETTLPSRAATSQFSEMEVDECEETTLNDVNMEEEMREHSNKSNKKSTMRMNLECPGCNVLSNKRNTGWIKDILDWGISAMDHNG